MLFSKVTNKAAHLVRGEQAEQQAQQFLINNGLKLISRNFRCQQGELDLIMTDLQTLVIVEVRFRQTDRYGSAAESVTLKKQSRIIAATQMYLAAHPTQSPIRFDVVALSGNGTLEWIKNAF
jgi:putative endonuclease